MDTNRYVEQLNFDREMSLDELIVAADTKSLVSILSNILCSEYQVKSMSGQTVLGCDTCQERSAIPIVIELEPIGYLIAETQDQERLETAKQCLLMQLRFAQKYLMASALHIEAIQEDYTTLCEEHKQLLASEVKYKTLSEHLDEKVNEQVHTIETAQRQLFESEKMASIGHLAAGVAHEINNPIGFINSNLNTAKNYISDFKSLGDQLKTAGDISVLLSFWNSADLDFVLDDFDELLSDCLSGGHRVAAIVADLKLFSNIDAEDEIEVDINKYIETSCNVARSTVGAGVEINFKQNPVPNLKCRPGYIGQVILALVLNASDAMAQEGRVELSSEFKNDKIYVSVKDSGPGIPDDVIDKVYDPFFTTKAVGEGKGLGLTSCRDIVIAHGGDINIDSGTSIGTTVTFWLPVANNT